MASRSPAESAQTRSAVTSTENMSIIAYVSCAASKSIVVLELNISSGRLRPVQQLEVQGTSVPSPTSLPMAISVDRRHLFAALRSPPFPMSTYAIASGTGRLMHMGSVQLPASMAYLNADPYGKHILCASLLGSKLVIQPLDSNDVAQQPATQVVENQSKAHCLLVSAASKTAYATLLGADAVICAPYQPEAGIIDMERAKKVAFPKGYGPRHLAFHPNYKHLYVLFENAACIATLDISNDFSSPILRQYTQFAETTLSIQTKAADIHLTPDGCWLFCSERARNVICGFKVDDTDGTLTYVGQTVCSQSPRSFAIDPSGTLLIALGEKTGMADVFGIDRTHGTLSLLERHLVGDVPSWIEIINC